VISHRLTALVIRREQEPWGITPMTDEITRRSAARVPAIKYAKKINTLSCVHHRLIEP
jgi:hypothetical protein